MISTKKESKSNKIKLKFGQVVYSGQCIALYETFETRYSGNAGGEFIVQSTSNYQKSYAKKSGDDYAYNIGYIYGLGNKGIKKRVSAYFADCQKWVTAIEEDRIGKRDVKAMIAFYGHDCLP
ncbi:hypothetical protein [Croceitalea dokdonensis]|uniref:hypothetical protein n=1 Tax=Croceitalea dokdonensis TaxID=346188 RepID=UPI0012FA39E1|nr:hypothetical protein [Croceitalea dokdonensis]